MDLQEIIRRVLELSQAADARGKNVEEALASIKSNASSLHGRLHDMEQRAAKLEDGGSLVVPTRGMAQSAAIQALVKGHEAELAALADQRGRVTLRAAAPITTRALTSLTGDSPAGGFPVAAVSVGGPPFFADPPRPLTLLQLIDHVPISVGNTLDGVRLVDGDSPPTPDQGAEVQNNEGDLKAERELTFEPAQTRLETVAVWTRVSRQLLADVPLLFAALRDLFANAVASKMERIAIAKLVTDATPYVSAETSVPDKVSEALASLEALGYVQPVVLMNPFRWHDLRTTRATGGSEEYLAGSWAQPAQPNVWGSPVVRNSAIGQNQVLIVDRSAARYLDRQVPSVEVSTEDQDNFVRNLATILAEARGAVEVMRPGGVVNLAL
jgi:HK97 family phage major capsid protein